ncbi:MAG: DUF1778 domain-containing protein [Propionibacteriaceae bacterium]|nr:DUF1778 domain-containing protein [Propionibacteriaceae bacterium]
MTLTVEPAGVKTRRISLRATPRQEQTLKWAAEATDHTLTDFVLDSAVTQAQMVLADRRWFAVSDEQYEAFLDLLDQPLPSTAKLARLFSEA